MDKREQKNRKVGMIVTIFSHGVLFLFFILFLAWTEPDPPIPDYGIEFNLGNSEISETKTDAPESLKDQEKQQDDLEVAEEIVEESVDQPISTETQEQVPTESVEETSEPLDTEQVHTEDINSPDVLEEVENEIEKPVKEAGNKGEPATEKLKAIDDRFSGKKVEGKSPKINEKAIYKGKSEAIAGGNEGASLDFSGWIWDFKPRPDDRSEESGKIIFEVTVDEEGEILGVRKIQSNISPVVEKKYRDAVMDLTFSRTSENRSVAATSKGRITFIIQSN